MADKNVTVEELDNEKHRESTTRAPAQETYGARVRQLGAWRQDNVADSQSGVALPYQSETAAALKETVRMRKGEILGVAWNVNAAITAGVATVKPTVDGTQVGEAVSVVHATAVSGFTMFATPVAYAQGAKIGVKITTDANVDPNTSELGVEVLVRESADAA
jgi:hypothetical protein